MPVEYMDGVVQKAAGYAILQHGRKIEAEDTDMYHPDSW